MDTDLEQDLIRRLDQADAEGANEASIETIRAELETLANEIRNPASPDPFSLEPELNQAIGRAQEIASSSLFDTNSETPTSVGDPSVPDASIPAPARLGQYEILEELGSGGMGIVYRARHTRLDRFVALKVLPSGVSSSSQMSARFDREMRAAGKLVHPHVVSTQDAGEADGTLFLAMELVDGCDLAALVAHVGPLRIADACEIIRQAAVGLQHIADHHMVHRDIKPSNLMLARTATPGSACVKILDLGLAIWHSEQSGVNELTGTGQIVGTVDYMSPEQGFSGDEPIDIRADLYSLGATLYKLLTGRAPFEDPKYATPMMRLKALERDAPALTSDLRSDCPRTLAELVARLLEKSPANRPSNPKEVADALTQFTQGADLAMLLQKAPKPKLREVRNRPASVRLGTVLTPHPDQTFTPLPSAISAPPKGSRILLWTFAIIGAFLSVATVATVITFVTDQGTLLIETPSDLSNNISVTLVRDGRSIESNWKIKAGPNEYRLHSGRIEVQIPKELADEFDLVTPEEMVVKRNKTVLIKLTRKPADVKLVVVPQQPIVPTATTDASKSTTRKLLDPPPLADWLRGRTEITVAQDGSGEFKTIQEALNALTPGQVVRILDRGPYRESFRFSRAVKDVGLVTEVGTVIEIEDLDSGCLINSPMGFRLHGFEFRYQRRAKQQALEVRGDVKDVVIENCLWRSECPDELRTSYHSVDLHIFTADGSEVAAAGPCVIRECVFSSGTLIGGHVSEFHAPFVLERCYYPSTNKSAVVFYGTLDLIMRHNVVQGSEYGLGIDVNAPSRIRARIENNFSQSRYNALNATEISDIMMQNNIFVPLPFIQKDRSYVSRWRTGHNAFKSGGNPLELPLQSTDIALRENMVCLDPNNSDYARIPSDSGLATAGVGGAQTDYVGAFPPGGVPAQSDWFSRLRDRWGTVGEK